MSSLECAIELAARAHSGQVDKADQPYILHPLRVMLAVDTLDERMAAVLHDVVEDTSTSFKDLEKEGFPEEVIEAVRMLTKLKGESRFEAAMRAKSNAIAWKVKIQDVNDNMDISRIKNPKKEDIIRIKEYEEVLQMLLSE